MIDRRVFDASTAAVAVPGPPSTDRGSEVPSTPAGPEAATSEGATEEDAATVETGGRRPAGSIDGPVPLSDDDGPPLEVLAADESAMASMLPESVALPVPAVVRPVEPESDNQAAPAMEELVERIPAGVRELLDELFRARFVRVSRVPAPLLKPR